MPKTRTPGTVPIVALPVGLLQAPEDRFTPRGAVVDLRFEENAGTKAIDSSGRGNHGAIVGSPLRSNHRRPVAGTLNADYAYGRVLVFTGDSSMVVNLPASSSLVGDGSGVTLLATMRLVGTGDNPSAALRLINIFKASNSHLLLHIDSLGRAAGGSPNGNAFVPMSGSTLTANKWYTLGITKTGNSVQLYLNGQTDSGVYTLASASAPGALAASVGGGGGSPFNGHISRAVICNRALTAPEMRNFYYDNLVLQRGIT